MKVKEIARTANIAWSPAEQYPIYIAAGTAAQQLDATFSTSAALELYSVNLAEPGLEMQKVGTMQSDCRFHKLAWGSYGMEEGDTSAGVLVGGGDNGNLFVWNPDKLLKEEDCLIHKLEKHTGAVAALDFNCFQNNLLASGASDSEIYIWDLNNTSNPMTPGAKSQPPDDVTCLAWNRQVQHILASTYAGRCVVWDLRKNEPIIKVSDSMSRIKCKLVAWHPEVATQMCLASEDDHTPVIQLWDLRFATSPLKTLENHQRGVLSIAWCPADPDLLLSCGKDNRIICWNPNSNIQTGEVVYELPTSNQWSFDVQWCPRNPGMISTCSFDSHISIYSLMGGDKPPQTPNKVVESFPSDPFSQHAQQQATEAVQTMALKKPPKWLRRPVGATFGFGGKLITFEDQKPTQAQQPIQRLVNISQVVTETDLVSRSNQLENAMTNGQFSEFCSMKVSNSLDETDESIWNFLKVHFEKDPRTRYLQLLGYDQTDLARKVTETTGSEVSIPSATAGVDAGELAKKMARLKTSSGSPLANEDSSYGADSPYIVESQTPVENGLPPDGSAAFDEIAAQEVDSVSDIPLTISSGDDFEGLISESLLMANFEAAVEVCLHNDHMAEAIILAIAGGPELLASTQKKFFKQSKSNLGRLISSVVTRDFENIVRTCDLSNWKEALAVSLTYAKADEFPQLCDILGSRLESEKHGALASNACLCYICAGNVDRLVECWAKLNLKNNSPKALQDLVEKVMVLRKAIEMAQGQAHSVGSGLLAEKLGHYAEMLASQGSLNTAMNYLTDSNEISLAIIRERMYYALGQAITGLPTPPRPFSTINVQPEGVPQQVAQPQAFQSQAQAKQRHPSAGYHQAQAGSTFQTTTTPSSTYYNQNQYSSFGAVSQPQVPAYQPQTTMYSQAGSGSASSAAGVSVGKGPLSQKYPSYQTTAASSAYDPYSQPGFQPQPGFPAQSAHGAASGFIGSQGQPATSQPNLFNPAAAAAQQSPGYSEKRSSTEISPSSLEMLRSFFPDSETATEIVKTFTPPPLSRRRSSKYLDRESIAGVVGSTTSPTNSRRHSVYNTESDLAGGPYVPPPASTAERTMPYQDSRPVPGWNDPPLLKDSKKKVPTSMTSVPTNAYEPPTPITQPIYGVPQNEQGPPGAPNFGTQIYNPGAYQQQSVPQAQQPVPQQAAAAPAVKPPKPVEKGPIPSEHQVLRDVFDKLAKQCLSSATNAQMKRKLEDVLRKLEILYDKLRDNALSQNVTLGLHQIVQCIQGYDYQNGMAYHTHLISQGNFSEISSFMPGIKVLMQTAMSLQVYVQ